MLAWLSLLALVVVVAVSCSASVHAGVLAIVLAWLLGVYAAAALGQPVTVKELAAGFPSELFLTLVGVTLLFAQAQANGTLERLALRAVRACRGSVALLPLTYFLLALGLATIGAGNIAAAALIAPMAMATAGRLGIPAALMAVVVAHGAIAGALSPFSPTGLIAAGLMERIGLAGHEWPTYLTNLAANTMMGAAAYGLLGGRALLRRGGKTGLVEAATDGEVPAADPPFERAHRVTLALVAALIVGAVAFKVHVGLGAFAAAALLSALRMGDDREAFRTVPWSVILLVCGVTVLTTLMEKTGGIDLFTSLLVRLSNTQTITGIIAFASAVLSVYSSTSGVVLPALLPGIPALVRKLGGGDPLAIAYAINIGGHLVDVSPLSTIGALCVASISPHEDRRRVFNIVLAWGLAMAVVAGLLCYLCFGVLGWVQSR